MKYFALLFILNFLMFKISCNTCNCSEINDENECKLCDNCIFFYKDDSCVQGSITLSSESSYYKKLDEEPYYEVVTLESTHNYKLIYGTKEIVDVCPNSPDNIYHFTFYNICHRNKPNNSIETSNDSKNYTCQQAYYKETIDGFDYYTCYSSDNCPSTFKYYTSSPKQCLNSCGDTIKKEKNGDSVISRCSVECFKNDTYYELEFEESTANGNIRYCLEKCPSEYKYYYIDNTMANQTKIYKCLDMCNNGHYSKDNICIGSNCQNEYSKIIIDINQKTFSCTGDCPLNFPYNYQKTDSSQNYCLKSCNDTINETLFFEKEKTYLHETSESGGVIRSCVKDNPEEGTYFKDDSLLKWVTDCKISPSGPFHDADSCKTSCEGYDCSTNDDFKCMNISDDPEYFLEESEHICYKTCPSYSGKGFHDSTNHKCTSCSNGYYRSGDKNCYSSCSDIRNDQEQSIQFYINYGEKLCFENGCTNNPLYKYTQYYSGLENPNPIICYQSCFNISGANYEKDNICYTDIPTEISDYYYYKIQYQNVDLTRYTSNPNECIQNGFPYFDSSTKECQSNCTFYKIMPTEKIIGKCCSELTNCKNGTFKFYNETDKIITDKCKEFTVVDIDGVILTNDSNCIITCPNNFCEDSINKLCYTECKHFYIENEKKIFTDKCDKYFFQERDVLNLNDVYKCVDICEKSEDSFTKYIYYLDSGQCTETCPIKEGNTNSFSYNTTTSHQPCLDKCKSEEFYYESESNDPIICLEKCDKYYKGIDSQICVDNCKDGEFIHPGNICSNNSCPSSATFFYTIVISNEPSNKVKKCVSNCENGHFFNYDYLLETFSANECLENCDGYIYNRGCYSSCPEGLYIENGEEDDSIKKCVSNCVNKFYNNSDTNRYECLDNCNDDYPFLTSSGECVKKCPINEIFIGSNNKCLTSCENDINKYYEEKEIISDDNTYKNYQCINSCNASTNNNINMEGSKECVSSCDNYLYTNGEEKICYKICISNKNSRFSFSTNVSDSDNGICAEECKIDGEKNFLSDKICKNGCNTLPNNIINDFDNSCVSKCNLTSDYKYLQNKSSDDNNLHCKNICESSLSTKRYLSSNYICIDKCAPPNNYVVEDSDFEKANECLSKCPENKPYMRKNDNGEYICSNKTCGEGTSDPYSYYYMDKNICLKQCGDDLYFYELNSKKYCVNYCDFFKDIKLYHFEDESNINNIKQCVLNCSTTSKQFTKMNGLCDNSCDTYEFHNDSEYICMSKCPYGTINLEDNICKKCKNLEPSQYIDENGNCIESCDKSNNGFIYHNKDDYICKDNCEDKFIEDKVCKDICETKLFMNGKICLDVCPPNKRFFVESETYSNKTCLNDCPKNYQFYKINSENNHYSCTNNCNAYIPNYDPKMNAKICLGTTCNETYPFYINDNETKKICYSECPTSTPYFIKENETLNHCYKECPIDYVHSINEYECIEYTKCKDSKNIKYFEKLCIDQCSKKDKIFIKGELHFCFDNCSIIPDGIKTNGENLKLTYDSQCLETCPGYSEEDDSHQNCICKRLFYYDKMTGFKTCLNRDLTLCESIEDYPILNNNTYECTNYCDGILSLSGYECYNYSYKCGENETLKIINGDKKCECEDKFYNIKENNRNVKKCLKKGDTCPSSLSLLIKDTNECVNECSNGYKLYGKTCISTCPSNTIENSENNKCECKGKWYMSDNYDVICISTECPIEKYLYVEDTKECVSSCLGTGSEVYYNRTCIHNCDNINNVEIASSNNDPSLKDISKQNCRCNNIWYYDLNGYVICTDNIESCDKIEGYNFKYIISSTKQCDNLCPDNYYKFNDECLLDCKNEHNKNETSKMCKCKNLWKYENGKIVCLDSTSCPDNSLLVKRTNECYIGETCPREDPLIYEKICYAKYNCPEDLNTIYDEINNKCACLNKWYKVDGKENCLKDTSDCPDDYPYFNSITKECVKTQEEITETDLFEFNNIYYRNCPLKTIKDENNKICICDPLEGYWYTYKDSTEKEKLKCGEPQCPGIKKYNIYKQKECILTCPSEYQYLYQGICYDKCPDLTEVIGNTKECQLKLVDNEINLENLEKTLTENIVDLYQKSTNIDLKNNTSVGQKIVTKNATVEFYGVNKKNKGLSNQPIKSDLSYIDISECIEKIYKSNKMDEKDDIVILKFDVNKIPNKFLINPVEYKLINSRTGKELDASICEHNSIRISYPVHDLINKYDKMTRKLRALEYMKIDLTSNNKDSLREKIDKGKEIVEEYNNSDIFNINDKIFSDICIAVEVDGKDLVLEDRINYFYPKLSLCENNCTYNHTDFLNERIYCDCSYKTEFDFEREYSPSIDLNDNQVKNDQNGNSNIGVMKCISNMKYTKSLKKNSGFIYSLIIIIIEFILLLIIAFYGISALGNKLRNKMNKNEDNFEKEEIDVINSNENENKKTEENIKTSERIMNNPTKKKKEHFGIEFIPQEYLFLFFNQGEKDVIKKVERDNVPFKTKYNTRVLLERKPGINYENINPRGPFPSGQNLLVIVDSMDEDINDYLGSDYSIDEGNNKNIVNISNNKKKNKFNQTYTSGIGSRYSHGKGQKREKGEKGEKGGFKTNQKAKLYRRNFDEFSYTDYDPSDENYSIYDIEEDEDVPHEKGLIDNLKQNQRFLRRNFDFAVKNKNKNIIEILFTEIIDKIYIIKILLFTRKFDILSLHLSVYLLCHTLLLVLNTLFFDIKTIKKIWEKDNYPGLGYYLGYGFLACLVVWIIYTIFLCLLTNNDKIKDILKMIHFNNKYQLNKNRAIEKKYKNLMWKVKFKFIVYSIIEYLALTFCFIYLSTFGTVYVGTISRAFKAYGIALIEILIIKIIYGIALAIMRHISLSKEKKNLYNVVLFMDTYLV